jgi:hypothetical protein
MVQLQPAIQIHSFENFGTLHDHMQALKSKYSDLLQTYEQVLGKILRAPPEDGSDAQNDRQEWAQEIRISLAGRGNSSIKDKGKDKEKKSDKANEKDKKQISLFKSFGKEKGKQAEEDSANWIQLDPISIFVGKKNKGLAELYFDSVNQLKESLGRIEKAISICDILKARTTMGSNVSIIVSFVNDIPVKVVLKQKDKSELKKYSFTSDFMVSLAR